VDIQPPDFETRVAILLEKAQQSGLELQYDLVELIATHIKTNIRVLESIIIRLLANSSLHGKEINRELVEEVIREFFQPLADQETALNVQGKADVIGDNTTLQSLIDGHYSKWDAEQKRKDHENKDGDERWVSQYVLEKVSPKQQEVLPEQKAEILEHYNNNIYPTNKAVAASVDSSATYCYAHPLTGGKQIVCESSNSISVSLPSMFDTSKVPFSKSFFVTQASSVLIR